MQFPPYRLGRAAALACLLPLAAWAQPAADARLPAPGQPIALAQAVGLALQGNAGIRIARAQWEGALGAAQQEAGVFDPLWTTQAQADRARLPLTAAERATLAAAGIAADDQRNETRGIDTRLEKLFANGVQATVSAGHAHLRDDQLAFAGQPRQNLGVLRFELRVPLARGAGDAATLGVRVADAEARAAAAELEHTAARTVLAAAQAYWNYAAQLEREAIMLAGERRGAALLEELRKLVDADEVPRAELQLAQGSLSERRAARFAAQQAVLEARRALGRVLGLDTPSLLRLGATSDGFPLPGAAEAGPDPATFAADLDGRRADLQALRERRAAAQLRLQAAQDAGQPRLDLLLGATRNSLAEGARAADFGAGFGRGAPPGPSIGVIYQRPLGENAAQGLLRTRLALADGLEAELRELRDGAESAVVAAAWGLWRAAGQLREAEAAARTYATGVDNERTKRRLGMATLIDVLAVEDRYQNALLAAVQARADHALAIARLRFEAGTLVTAQGDARQARVDALLLPDFR